MIEKNMKKEEPLVSVCCITYNQEKFIRQTLDGFVMQQTTFPFEVVISDDCSKDSTRQIIAEYKAKYPEMFRDVSPEKNMGSMENFFYSQEQAKGKYIAMCEGDDYWIDPLKLQKQVDFLESHPDYVIVFHPVKVWIEEQQRFIKDTFTQEVAQTTTQLDLANINYMHTPSVMFRVHKEIYPIIHSFGHFLPDDYVGWMLTAEYGKIYRMDEEMAVYRAGVGIWSGDKTIKSDLDMLMTLNKLWLTIEHEDVKERLLEQINKTKQGIMNHSARQQKDLETIRASKAYCLGKWLLNPYKSMRKG